MATRRPAEGTDERPGARTRHPHFNCLISRSSSLPVKTARARGACGSRSRPFCKPPPPSNLREDRARQCRCSRLARCQERGTRSGSSAANPTSSPSAILRGWPARERAPPGAASRPVRPRRRPRPFRPPRESRGRAQDAPRCPSSDCSVSACVPASPAAAGILERLRTRNPQERIWRT